MGRSVDNLYSNYEVQVWPGGAFSQGGWDTFVQRGEICQIPFSQPLFFAALLFIWTGTCFIDLKETVLYMGHWWTLDEPSTDRDNIQCLDESIVAMTATRTTKMFVTVFVLLPKLVIGGLLWWLGARWLAATPNFQDLVLNTIALEFITGLDELMYGVALPKDVMGLVDMYKIARPRGERIPEELNSSMLSEVNQKLLFRRLVHMLGSIVCVTVLPPFWMYFIQEVIPVYKWDVNAVCEASS